MLIAFNKKLVEALVTVDMHGNQLAQFTPADGRHRTIEVNNPYLVFPDNNKSALPTAEYNRQQALSWEREADNADAHKMYQLAHACRTIAARYNG